MAIYAANTNVSVEASQQEIQKILRKYGADRFGVMEDKDSAYIMFQYNNFMIQIQVPLPERSMTLNVKAKLEYISSGLSTIEREFMAEIVLPNGQLLGEYIHPQLKELGDKGALPKLTFNK